MTLRYLGLGKGGKTERGISREAKRRKGPDLKHQELNQTKSPRQRREERDGGGRRGKRRGVGLGWQEGRLGKAVWTGRIVARFGQDLHLLSLHTTILSIRLFQHVKTQLSRL